MEELQIFACETRLNVTMLETANSWQTETINYLESVGKTDYYPALLTKYNKSKKVIVHFFTINHRAEIKICTEVIIPNQSQIDLSQKEIDYLSDKLCRNYLNTGLIC
ncbi:hypothetical protein [Laspinema olomoucense]|uniref:hypothetical protein n=1 Tax=Laspinema olomoucense TaxID=3231600 RepID=UPI0021BBA9A0|nr:hypothetical protein [Laspinema sp. D3c]MCT7992491.1 hypothetical protein [Laspinema sp. D3c]